ncbi:MAG: argininosuccinate lyase, partial [Desulfomicrobiaceae bacterium]
MSQAKPWGGRFAEATAPEVERYTCSLDVDRHLAMEDIAGSKAHARMLARQGILSEAEAQAIVEGLDRVADEIRAGTFPWRESLEDVHMNIETRLVELIGEPGRKLHTGRSRNDQTLLDTRLATAKFVRQWRQALVELIGVLLARAKEHCETLLPGCTHFQPAQPVSLAHHLLAYAQMFRRDVERIDGLLPRVEVSPLGAAALAGTTYPLDPAAVAAEVGFGAVFANSMDAVADRDFLVEAVCCASIVMMHASRLCEEIIIWANPQLGFVRLPDAYSTGSSIMPQKKNPDVAELMRGKTGRVYGDLVALLTMMKGLPLTYNRDLQEDKAPLLDAHATVHASVRLLAGMMARMEFVPEAMARALQRGYINATELADYLVTRGVPFRDAHHQTGAVVAYAEGKGVGLEELSLEEIQRYAPKAGPEVFDALRFEAAVSRRNTPGGTGPAAVAQQMAALQAWLDAQG